MNQLKYIKGETDILVIAPHGVMGDDDYTSDIVEYLPKLLGCSIISNTKFTRPKHIDSEHDVYILEASSYDNGILDLNRDWDAIACPEYLDAIEDVISANNNKTVVVWVHGISDRNADKTATTMQRYREVPSSLHALLGYGQSAHAQSVVQYRKGRAIRAEHGQTVRQTGITMFPHLAHEFGRLLSRYGMHTSVAPTSSIYCAQHAYNMTQWFRKQRISLTQVESVQLEIRKLGFRQKHCVKNTATIIANALEDLLR